MPDATRKVAGVRITDDPSTDPQDYEFRHELRVRFAETDARGIVHHSRYLPMIEEARVAFLRHIGKGIVSDNNTSAHGESSR